MIPKVIHYIWIGGKPEPKILKKCKKSWKKFCPDYEIKRWDESNLDLEKYHFAKDAYDAKKWAFASDVFRFDILASEGGIYLDTDVELIKPIDEFLKYEFFTGFEDDKFVAPGLIMGAEKDSRVVKDLIDVYGSVQFDVNSLLDITICQITTRYFEECFNLKREDKTQNFENGKIAIFSSEYFCPKQVTNNKRLKITSNTYSIHHYAASWVKKAPLIKRFYWKMKDVLKNIFAKNKKE